MWPLLTFMKYRLRAHEDQNAGAARKLAKTLSFWMGEFSVFELASATASGDLLFTFGETAACRLSVRFPKTRTSHQR